jgi:mono/diheme cytochrome c family protein
MTRPTRRPLSFLLTLLTAPATLLGLAACEGDDPTPPGKQITVDPPSNQSTVISEVRPPPLSGGTLLATKNGQRLIVSDPDRDRVLVVDAVERSVVAEIALQPGDEPGRAVEDLEGRSHIALRGARSLLSVDNLTGEVLGRREVCAAPRGVALSSFDDSEDSLLVACASGELVELGTAPDAAIQSSNVVGADLRDIVVVKGASRQERKLLVSSFRSAEVLSIGPDMKVIRRGKQGNYTHDFSARSYSPTVAWRMIPDPSGTGALMLHQRSSTTEVVITDPEEPRDESNSVGSGCFDCGAGGGSGSGYGGDIFDCGSTIVNAATTGFSDDGEPIHSASVGGLGGLLLPVDLASHPSGSVAALAAGAETVVITTTQGLQSHDGCTDNFVDGLQLPVGPEPIAVAFTTAEGEFSGGDLVVQLREPSMLIFYNADNFTWSATVNLGGPSRADSGHKLFHRNPEAPSTISCASCHPEGREDAHAWLFSGLGLRRTQSLEGNIMNTAPFHWDGDQADLDELMVNVFQHRMGGFAQSAERVAALNSWLETMPVVAGPALDAAAVARGKALFESSSTECATCHAGEQLTRSGAFDVGTGKPFQVPSLVGIRNRAPFMHDGCAETLADRFDESCGGDKHGKIDQLSQSDINDLVTYMLSL